MYEIYSTNELQYGDKILVFECNIESVIKSKQKGIIILDFSRRTEEPDLKKLPARFEIYCTLQEKYLIEKFNVVLGEL